MGKKGKGKGLVAPSSVQLSEETLGKIKASKDAADKLFVEMNYSKAIDTYDQAIKLLPDSNASKPDVLVKKAACYYKLKRYKEAIKESSKAIDLQPNHSIALLRRAQALEAQQLYKDALSDIQTILKSNEQASPEVKRTEQNLKKLLAGKRSNGAQQQQMLYFTARCSYKGELRLVYFNQSCSYADLLDEIHSKYPNCGDVRLTYTSQGEQVTITCRMDLQTAMQEAYAAYERNYHSETGAKVPTITITVENVNKEDVPQPPAEELALRKAVLEKQKQQRQQQYQQQQQQSGQDGQDPSDVVEVEEWVVDFAQLFKEMLHIGVDRRVDLQTLGWERCQQALDASVKSEKARPLFEQAANRFKDMTAVGLNNWGMVIQYMMQKDLDTHINAGGSKDIVANAGNLQKFLDDAEKKFNEALSYHPEHFDTLLSLATLHATRAKVRIGFYLPINNKSDAKEGKEGEGQEGQPEESAEEKGKKDRAVQREKLVGICSGLDKKKLKQVQELFNKSHKLYEQALATALQQDKEQESSGKQSEEVQDSPKSQVLMAYGNTLFEESLIQAGVQGDWESLLLEAINKFREGGAREQDIKNATELHLKMDQIKIPPLPQKEEEKKDGPAGVPKLPAKK